MNTAMLVQRNMFIPFLRFLSDLPFGFAGPISFDTSFLLLRMSRRCKSSSSAVHACEMAIIWIPTSAIVCVARTKLNSYGCRWNVRTNMQVPTMAKIVMNAVT